MFHKKCGRIFQVQWIRNWWKVKKKSNCPQNVGEGGGKVEKVSQNDHF